MKTTEETTKNKVLTEKISTIWSELRQPLLFSIDDGNVNDAKYSLFIAVCNEVIDPTHFRSRQAASCGRPKANRLAIYKAMIFKATMNIPDTKSLVRELRCCFTSRRLCGWTDQCDVPSESTFSRAFKEFADEGFTGKWFEEFVIRNSEQIKTDEVCYDSAPVKIRAKPPEEKPQKVENRIAMQSVRDVQTNISELPADCRWGMKVDSNGKKLQWKGGKIHIATTRNGFPLAMIYTSANLHDSQAMIPLMQLASSRMAHKYNLADAAYDAESIRNFSLSLNVTPIIDANPRRDEKKKDAKMSEEDKAIYNGRSVVESYFSHHLEGHGGRTVRVRTPEKITLHLMLGTIVIAVEQLMKLAA